MTKKVRIENADNSDHQIQVEIWEETTNGPLLVKTEELTYPAQMLETYIWNGRYLTVKELKNKFY